MGLREWQTLFYIVGTFGILTFIVWSIAMFIIFNRVYRASKIAFKSFGLVNGFIKDAALLKERLKVSVFDIGLKLLEGRGGERR